jgi:hypothetical protein
MSKECFSSSSESRRRDTPSSGRVVGPDDVAWPNDKLAEPSRCENVVVVVGVPLRRDNTDPGRGLGLGLGGPSMSVSSDSDSMGRRLPRREGSCFVLSVSSSLTGMNRSSLTIPERLTDTRTRGLRPLSSTFFRALIPTQLTSCCMASRSETDRLGAVRRLVLVRGSEWCGGNRAFGRMGVTNGFGAEMNGICGVRRG